MIKKIRLKVLLYNAVMLLFDEGYTHNQVLESLGLTDEEFDEIVETFE